MNSREKILVNISKNEPAFIKAPEKMVLPVDDRDVIQTFGEVFKAIGGDYYEVRDVGEIAIIIGRIYPGLKRIVSTVPGLFGSADGGAAGMGSADVESSGMGLADAGPDTTDGHAYADVDLFIMTSGLGVADSGAVWITEKETPARVLPFITQHLAVIIHPSAIVANLHEAYDRIGREVYGFATYIAGPSRTADIGQSLVLGAHGPRTMTLFLLKA